MKKIDVHSSKEYSIYIENGLWKKGEFTKLIKEVSKAKKIMLVTDDIVLDLYGYTINEILTDDGFDVSIFDIPNGEESKNLKNYSELMECMCAEKFTRSDMIIALGGGVVGDLAGFAAATYQRGIDFVQIPTTLLACVDSSVGGKTAVDLEHGKNQVGAFKQPNLVIIDPFFLKSLPKEQVSAGAAEVIKYAMIEDEEFFESLKNTPIEEQYEEVIAKCVDMKREFVENDEFDTGVRMMLNFGHTVGHAIEAASGYKILHGEAVAMGMDAVTKACEKMNICEEGTYKRLNDLLGQYNLKRPIPYGIDELFEHMKTDKKNAGGKTRLIVPTKVGHCEIKEIDTGELKNFLAEALR